VPRSLAENHATDRADCTGQNRPVFIRRLVTTVTLEEALIAPQRLKRERAEGLIANDREAATALSTRDREALLRPLGQET